MNTNNIGKNIKSIMEFLEISQIELSRKTGQTPAAISQIINGNRKPSVDSILKIMQALGCSFERLLK